LYAWVRWRLDQVTQLVGELSRAFRERNPKGQVVARGFANLYRWAPSARLRTAQDWLNWAVEGHVDELILEGQWAAAENQNAYALALGLVQKAGVDVEVTPLLIPYEEEGHRVGYEEQLQVLQKQATLERVVLQVASPQDWEEAKAFLAKEHPVIETPLDTTSEVVLEDDARLKKPLSLTENLTPLPELLARLGQELQVPLRAEGIVQEAKVSLVLPEQPAASVLREIARQVGGTWQRREGEAPAEPQEAAYVLHEVDDPDRLRGDRLRQEGQMEEAIAAYQQAIAKGKNLWAAWFGTGLAYLAQNNVQAALPAFEEAQAVDPDEVRVEVEIGHCYRYLGDVDSAVEHYEAFLERYPDDLWGLLGLGAAQTGRKDLEAALAPLEKAAQLYPNESAAHAQLGHLYHERGELEKSAAALERAVALQPANVDAQVELGHVAMARSDYKRAIQAFAAALEHDPKRTRAYVELGHCHRFLGKQDQAIAAYEKFLEVYPDDLWGLIGISAAWVAQEKPTEALLYLGRAARVGPADPWVSYFLARAYVLLGEREKALAALEKALASDPNNAEAQKLLQELQKE
jgi:tetratricopeptide (TPR) repeat protein